MRVIFHRRDESLDEFRFDWFPVTLKSLVL